MKITAKYLTKVYKGGVYALDGFSVDIESGDFVCILGESGCGKTTLLRLLSGLEKPTAGELYFDGTLFSDLSVRERDTALVFQDYVLYPNMTVWENVAMALDRYDLDRGEVDKRVYKALDEFGLLPCRGQLPRVLSGGQQQRVALARAIVKDPSLILFDEPLSNVAEEQRRDYMRVIRDLKAAHPKTTFIYVTHNVREALVLGDKILVMHDGKVLRYGTKSAVWKDPYNAEVLRTFGECEEEKATVKGEVVTTESGNTFALPDCRDGEVTVIYNAYDGGTPCFFGADEEALSGERRIVRIDGTFDGKTIKFGDTSIKCDGEYVSRVERGVHGSVGVGIPTASLRTYPLYGDVKIVAERGGQEDLYRFAGCDGTAIVRNADQFDGAFYIDPADIILYKRGRAVTGCYKLYDSKCTALLTGSFAKLPSGELRYKSDTRRKVRLGFKANAVATIVKRGGLRAECLCEEDAGDMRRAYFMIRGFDGYVAMYADKSSRFFSEKKLRIDVQPEMITVE